MDKQTQANGTVRIQTFFITLLALFSLTYSEKILLLPHLQGSHVFEITAIGEQMVKNGHDVYCAIPSNSKFLDLLQKKHISALIFEADTRELMESNVIDEKTNDLIFGNGDGKDNIIELFLNAGHAHCEYMLNDMKFVDKVKSKNFDLAIVDTFIFGHCILLLPHQLSIPYVAASQSVMDWEIGVPFLPSFMYMGMQEEHKGTFMDKLKSLGFMLMFNSPFMPFKQNKTLLHKYAPEIDSYLALVKASKLFVITRDYILDVPSPKMPNVVRVPGYSYKPAEQLPKSLSDQIPKDKQIIVVSFGSTAGNMPKDTIIKFLDAFATFPNYVVLWKLPNANGVKLPKNVITLPWLPQNDILGHNQTALFITHCGANGLHEAFYHGVPLIGFPLFAEQHHNAKMISNKGYGLSLDIKTFTLEQLVSVMGEILKSDVYKKRILKVSAMLHDRVPPKEEIAYWIEHVMKYGDDHIRSVSIDMPLYELYMLDILALLLVCIVTLCYVSFIVLKCLCHRICGKRSETKLKSA